MPDARGHTVTARIAATAAATDAPAAGLAADEIVTEWTASGRTITFPGWQAAYGYGEDDADDTGDATAKLPQLEKGQALPSPDVEAAGHTTQPPSRYTDAPLVTALEEKGIGRPPPHRTEERPVGKEG